MRTMGRRQRPMGGYRERLRFDREQIGQLRRLFGFLRPYRKWLVVATIGVAVSAALGLVFPRIMGTLVDTALDETDTSTLDTIALILLGVFAVPVSYTHLTLPTIL